MACSPVNLAAFLFIASAVMAPATATDMFCRMHRYSRLTQFVDNGNDKTVQMPCKYILADFRDSTYRVKVSVENNLDPSVHYRFTPESLQVEIDNLVNGQVWKAKTDRSKLNTKPTNTDKVWRILQSSLTPDEVTLTTDRIAKVKLNGVFELTYSEPNEDDKGIDITVFGPVTSKAYPDTLCGATDAGVEYEERQETLFGTAAGITRSAVFAYDVLNNLNNQPSACKNIRKQFAKCDPSRQARAVMVCSVIYTRRVSKCLMDVDDPQGNFVNCMIAVCNQDAASCQTVNDKVCPGLSAIDCNPA